MYMTANQRHALNAPMRTPQMTWLHVWYCRQILEYVTINAAAKQNAVRAVRQTVSRVVRLFMCCNLEKITTFFRKNNGYTEQCNNFKCFCVKGHRLLDRENGILCRDCGALHFQCQCYFISLKRIRPLQHSPICIGIWQQVLIALQFLTAGLLCSPSCRVGIIGKIRT